MGIRRSAWGYSALFAGLAFTLFPWATGCRKETPVVQQQAGQDAQAAMHAHAAVEQPKTGAAAREQRVCPVMGGDINKAIFVEYQGKTVYFCCKSCPDAFRADPQRYIARLPQFAK